MFCRIPDYVKYLIEVSLTACPFDKFQPFRNTYKFLKNHPFFRGRPWTKIFWQNQNVKSGIRGKSGSYYWTESFFFSFFSLSLSIFFFFFILIWHNMAEEWSKKWSSLLQCILCIISYCRNFQDLFFKYYWSERILITGVKWVTFSHWRLLNAGYEQPQYGDIHECLYAFVVDQNKYFFIFIFLKLSNLMGINDWSLCFRSFKTLLCFSHRKRIVLCHGGGSNRFLVFGEAMHHWTRHASSFTFSSPMCRPVVIQFFRQRLPAIQPFPSFSRAKAARHILWFYSLK